MKTLICSLAFGALLLRPVAKVSAAAFTDPLYSSQTNGTAQYWNGFTSATGPNVPTLSINSAGTANWKDTTADTDGVFMIGNHVYSPDAALHLRVDVPTPVVAGGSTAIVLQAEMLGNPLDLTSFFATPLGGVAVQALPADITETLVGSSGDPRGGGDVLYKVVWNNLPSAASYVVTYVTGGTSSSQTQARVDTLTTAATPEPASLALLGIGGLLLGRRRSGSK